MVSQYGIRAGRTYVEILAKMDGLERGLRKAQAKLRAFSAGVKEMGAGMAAVSAAILAPAAASTKVYAGFAQQMARVRALTGASGKEFADLTAAARRLGETTVFTASQSAEAMSAFALAGYDVQKILKAIGPTLKLAASGQLEIGQAADISTKIMAGMGLEADDLGHAVDVLTKAMTTANTDLAQLGDAMKYIGPVAKSAGISLEGVIANVQLLSNAGIQAEMAGTTLRGMLLQLTSPSAEAANRLKQLGVAVVDVNGNVRALVDIIDDLNAAMAGMGTGARLDVLGTIFSQRQAAGAAELLAQGGAKLREYIAALEVSGGTAAEIAAIQLNTLGGDATLLRSAIEGLALALGNTLNPVLRVIANALTKAVSAIRAWLSANGELVLMVTASVAGIGALGAGLLSVGLAAQVAAFAVAGLGTVLAATTAVAGMLFSPIALIGVAVGGLGTLLAARMGVISFSIDWLRSAFTRLAEGVRETTQAISAAFKDNRPELAAKILWDKLYKVWHTKTQDVRKLWRKFTDFLAATWAKVAGPLKTAGIIVGSIVGLHAALIGVVAAANAAVVVGAGLWGTLGAIAAAASAVLTPVGLIGSALVALGAVVAMETGAIRAAIDWVRERFSGLLDSVREVVQGISNALASGRPKLAAKILWDKLHLVWLEGTQTLRELWIKFKYSITLIWIDLTSTLKRIWIDTANWFYDRLPEFTKRVGVAFSSIAAQARKAFVLTKGVLTGWELSAKGMFNDVREARMRNLLDVYSRLISLESDGGADFVGPPAPRQTMADTLENDRKLEEAKADIAYIEELNKLRTAVRDQRMKLQGALYDADFVGPAVPAGLNDLMTYIRSMLAPAAPAADFVGPAAPTGLDALMARIRGMLAPATPAADFVGPAAPPTWLDDLMARFRGVVADGATTGLDDLMTRFRAWMHDFAAQQAPLDSAIRGADTMADLATRSRAAGTFDASIAARLAGDTYSQRTIKAAEKTAKATEETSRNTQELKESAQAGRLVFTDD